MNGTALLLYTILLCALLGAGGGLLWHYRAQRRRWLAEDATDPGPFLPPWDPAPLSGLPIISSRHVPRGSGYVTEEGHGRMLVLHPDDYARIKRSARPRPYPGPIWPNTSATAAAGGLLDIPPAVPPMEDDDGGRRGD